jgi:hypothetical protein
MGHLGISLGVTWPRMKPPHDTRKNPLESRVPAAARAAAPAPAACAACAFVLTALTALATATPARAALDGRATPESSAKPAEGSPDQGASRPRVGIIVGVGFPRPLGAEAIVKVDRFAFGAEYGTLPEVNVGGVYATMWSVAADARVFPFGGEFFVGLRAGRQHVDAHTTISLAQYGAISEALALDSWYLNPRFGILWRSEIGLTLGIEAGVQFPVSPSTTSSLPLNLVPGAQSAADSLGKAVLPTVDLMRIGFLL